MLERRKEVHVEYLKNIVFRFLRSDSHEEKVALLPVISRLLTLTPDEAADLQKILAQPTSPTSLTSIIPKFFGS